MPRIEEPTCWLDWFWGGMEFHGRAHLLKIGSTKNECPQCVRDVFEFTSIRVWSTTTLTIRWIKRLIMYKIMYSSYDQSYGRSNSS